MTFDPKERQGAIWSTEAAAALGLSERTTPAQLWARKLGHVEEADQSDNIAARLGLACQDGVAKLHVEDTGNTLLPLHDVALRRDVKGVRMGSHFDFYNSTLKRLHEVKFFALARSKEFGETGSDVVPYDVLVQCLHEMVVWNAESTGYDKADACEVNVVFGNIIRAVYVVPYDEGAVDKLLKEEAAFQALVDSNKPPEPRTTDDARAIWRKSNGTEVIADPVTLRAHQALMQIRHQRKQLEAQEEAITLHIQQQMQEAAVLKAPQGHVLATWKDVTSERIDVKRLRAELPDVAKVYAVPSTSRRFLPKE